MTSNRRPTETELIAWFLAPLASDAAAFRLGDDAAALTPPDGEDLVLTKDVLVAGIHFFADDPPGDIARKALRVNLSDLAAKGARPLAYLLGLGLHADWTADWLATFTAGLADDQRTYGLALLGGDTVSSPERLTLSVTAIGRVPRGGMLRRDGARPGDIIAVTGSIGDAAIGLQLRLDAGLSGRLGLSEAAAAHLLGRYLLPQPRSGLAEAVQRLASAGMDVSDGLAGDLAKMAGVSGVRIEIDAGSVPLSEAPAWPSLPIRRCGRWR
ncbi:Thiamine-monophosphate kinase [Methylobrevis pamukkalensis]|uniref:Thiamine-monophosphate kinase n=1 Tax=Methylobrevis pamukkalensis TaxID=1439726 RepID=A0A1E3GXK2_9HYPH|nr:Thiamine-monophosphate kinase [Methylobrevis pamukkalensis]